VQQVLSLLTVQLELDWRSTSAASTVHGSTNVDKLSEAEEL